MDSLTEVEVRKMLRSRRRWRKTGQCRRWWRRERLFVGWSKTFPILGSSRDRYFVLMLDSVVHGFVHPHAKGGGDVPFLPISLG